MNLDQLLRDISIYKKNIQSVVKLLKDISSLEQDRMGNLSKLRARLDKLDEIIEKFNQGVSQSKNVRSWVNQYKRNLDTAEAKLQKSFGVELEQELKKRGLSLSGQYPELKVGFFTIELDFVKGRIVLWYGPKQERLNQCPLSAAGVAKEIEKVKQQLGTQLSEEEFLNRLHEAYSRVAGSKRGEPVPIIGVLSELSYLLQSPRFHRDPRRENYKSYSRADFSYDLFRVRRIEPRTLFDNRLHLTVATRAHTKRGEDFIWVPDNESGRGTTYSHLQFKEVPS